MYLTETSANFWKRAIVDFITATIFRVATNGWGWHAAVGVAVVQNVSRTDLVVAARVRCMYQNYVPPFPRVAPLDCTALFQVVFGIGTNEFLRHKRLCAIHSVLRDSNPAAITVGQVAIQHGFIELGRFSHYYHSLFGEYPSKTLGAHSSRARSVAGSGFRQVAFVRSRCELAYPQGPTERREKFRPRIRCGRDARAAAGGSDRGSPPPFAFAFPVEVDRKGSDQIEPATEIRQRFIGTNCPDPPFDSKKIEQFSKKGGTRQYPDPKTNARVAAGRKGRIRPRNQGREQTAVATDVISNPVRAQC